MSTTQETVLKVIEILTKATSSMRKPMVTLIAEEYGRDPFLILISCLLSLRAKDIVTYGISKKLFEYARTPQELVKLKKSDLEKLFHPLGFYRKKAEVVLSVSQELIDRFGAKVPSTLEELLSIKGVGRKTANLVLGEGFNIPAICVDTHVHRLANRLGWVHTANPDDTERELQKIVPKKYWVRINQLFVMWGQNVCVPISPWCSKCVISPLCPKIGVVKHR